MRYDGSILAIRDSTVQMLSDERLDRIEKTICDNLNEDSFPSKVELHPPYATQAEVVLLSGWYRSCQRQSIRHPGKLAC